MHPNVHSSTIAKCWKQPTCPSVNECIRKLWYIHTMEYLSSRKKKLLPFVTVWMEWESIMLTEISQPEEDIPRALTYTWTLMSKIN